jgi:hypothetical protein
LGWLTFFVSVLGAGIGAPWRGTLWLRGTACGRWNWFFGMSKSFRYPRPALSTQRRGFETGAAQGAAR